MRFFEAGPQNKIFIKNQLTLINTVQKGERVRLVLLMQCEKILYMTDTVGVASSLADFTRYLRLHHWNTLLVAEVTFQHIPRIPAMQTQITRKNPPKMNQYLHCPSHKEFFFTLHMMNHTCTLPI
jgi:hypothetical protein